MQYRICSFHFLYTRLILDLMRPLVDRWSPLTHTSHCMTTSRPAAAMQMRVRACPAMHPKLFLCQMPFLPQTSLFLGLGTGSHTETSRDIFHFRASMLRDISKMVYCTYQCNPLQQQRNISTCQPDYMSHDNTHLALNVFQLGQNIQSKTVGFTTICSYSNTCNFCHNTMQHYVRNIYVTVILWNQQFREIPSNFVQLLKFIDSYYTK